MSADTIARTAFKQGTKPLYDYDKHWASCYEPAPYLPMSRKEMDELGWDACDVIIISGDAYVDHPSFGMAIIGRLLEAQGFRVGIIAQPDWKSKDAFMELGKPVYAYGGPTVNVGDWEGNFIRTLQRAGSVEQKEDGLHFYNRSGEPSVIFVKSDAAPETTGVTEEPTPFEAEQPTES